MKKTNHSHLNGSGNDVVRIITLSIVCFVLHSCTQSGKSDNDGAAVKSTSSTDDSALFRFTMMPFGNTEDDHLAEYGEKLVKETYNYFYKDGKKIGNHLSCQNCHLNGGTKPFGIPFIGVANVFPTYIGRENKVVSLEDRINGCFERSMNGEAIPEDSREMKAIVAYIGHLSRNLNNPGRMAGQGTLPLTPPDRKADLARGKLVYQEKCQSCHMQNGQGIKLPDSIGYVYPPLWGPDSFNDGAGMGRVLTAARFIKGNMPFGTVYNAPQLSDDEAYDVAAYINSFSRPVKAHKGLDYPDLTKKPKDCPYPPYADKISQEQHKYGPFNF